MEKLAFSINGTQISGAGGVPTGGLINTGSSAIGLFIGYMYIGAIILALFFLIWGGFDWLTSGGDKQKLAQAREKLIFTIIGLIIVFLAFFIINVITNFFLGTSNGGGGGGGKKKGYIQKIIYPNLASNWGLDKFSKTLYSIINT